jgi:hypothetical protein
MSNDGLSETCVEILRWLKNQPAIPEMALAARSATLRDLLVHHGFLNRSASEWGDDFRILDKSNAIRVQVFDKSNHDDVRSIINLYSVWYSPLRAHSEHSLLKSWDTIVRRGSVRCVPTSYSKKISGGILRSFTLGQYLDSVCWRLRGEENIPDFDKDSLRIISPRLRITECGLALVARAGRTQRVDDGPTTLVDPIPVAKLRDNIPKGIVEGDSSKLLNYLRRPGRDCRCKKIANKWYVERSDVLKLFAKNSNICKFIKGYGLEYD